MTEGFVRNADCACLPVGILVADTARELVEIVNYRLHAHYERWLIFWHLCYRATILSAAPKALRCAPVSTIQ